MSAKTPQGLVTPQDLLQTRDALAREIDFLKDSYSQLHEAESRFQVALRTLVDLKDKDEMLVPVTESIFFPGKLLDGKRVKVDIGTGWMIEKSIEEAKEYYGRKIGMLREQYPMIESKIKEQNAMLGMVLDALNKVSKNSKA